MRNQFASVNALHIEPTLLMLNITVVVHIQGTLCICYITRFMIRIWYNHTNNVNESFNLNDLSLIFNQLIESVLQKFQNFCNRFFIMTDI